MEPTISLLQSSISNQIAAQFVGSTGDPIGNSINIGRLGSLPLVSFDGANYLVVWADVVDLPSSIYGQLISREGAMVGAPFLIGADVNALEVGGVQFGDNNY